MGQAYPELLRAEPLIIETLRLEETRFHDTLARGLSILDEASRSLKPGDALDGKIAFKLYDTYGFPLDLTQDVLRATRNTVDVMVYNEEMERQRQEARKAWAGSGELATEALWYAIKEKTGATEFLGYDMERAEGLVAAILKDGKEVPALGPGEAGSIILYQTPFYGNQAVKSVTRVSCKQAGFASASTIRRKTRQSFVHEGLSRKASCAWACP
jgi:alanyl-tRNA synthetase